MRLVYRRRGVKDHVRSNEPGRSSEMNVTPLIDVLLVLLVLFMIALLAVFGWIKGLSWPFYAGVAAAAVMFALQLYRVRTRDRDACFRAFTGNNRVGLAVFLGLAGHFLLY